MCTNCLLGNLIESHRGYIDEFMQAERCLGRLEGPLPSQAKEKEKPGRTAGFTAVGVPSSPGKPQESHGRSSEKKLAQQVVAPGRRTRPSTACPWHRGQVKQQSQMQAVGSGSHGFIKCREERSQGLSFLSEANHTLAHLPCLTVHQIIQQCLSSE